jgi:tetratricopeptide (TPR) repeat protein
MGRLEEALRMSRRAQELDPLSPHAHAMASMVLLFASKNDEAILVLQKLLEMHPDFHQAWYYLSWAYSAAKEHEKAIAAAERGVATTGRASLWLSLLGEVCALGGQRDRSWQIIKELEERAKREYIAPMRFAHVFLGLAKTEEALSWLEKAYEHRDPFMVNLRSNIYDPIRYDPRFHDLLRRMNLH